MSSIVGATVGKEIVVGADRVNTQDEEESGREGRPRHHMQWCSRSQTVIP